MKWWQSGIIYQIYPRSYNDTSGNGIGDLKGIIDKLDYLNDGSKDSLGIDAIWLSPIYQSPMKDHGYDISDYYHIDPLFGSDADFDLLLEEAHKRGIKIIMDLVVNHTSDQHPWFIESRESIDNDKRDWYLWQDKRVNNWFSEFSLRSSWNHDKLTDSYFYAFFTKEQPELNWRNEDVKEAVYDIIRYWFKKGVDGFRLDVVNYYMVDDLYRSNPRKIKVFPPEFQHHVYDRNHPEMYNILRELRAVADEFDDKMLIGEVFTDDSALAISYQGNGEDMLHLAYNFDFLYQPFNAAKFYTAAMKWYQLMPEKGWPNFTLSNHDQQRHYSRYMKTLEGTSRAKISAAMLLTLKGTPTLYYGEEIGMDNKKLKRYQLHDPMGVKYFPLYKGRDGSRTPMQWDSSKHAGFTESEPWLPVHQNYRKNNVSLQKRKVQSVYNLYRRLIWFRKEHEALSIGDIEFVHKGERDVLGFKRFTEKETLYVYLNFTNFTKSVQRMSLEECVLFSSKRSEGSIISDNMIVLKPYEILIMA